MEVSLSVPWVVVMDQVEWALFLLVVVVCLLMLVFVLLVMRAVVVDGYYCLVLRLRWVLLVVCLVFEIVFCFLLLVVLDRMLYLVHSVGTAGMLVIRHVC